VFWSVEEKTEEAAVALCLPALLRGDETHLAKSRQGRDRLFCLSSLQIPVEETKHHGPQIALLRLEIETVRRVFDDD
jgi:hypothetical protein